MHDIVSVHVIACDRLRDPSPILNAQNNGSLYLFYFPPVLPHDLVELTEAQFLCKERLFLYCLKHRYLKSYIVVIGDKQKVFRDDRRTQPELRHGIDTLPNRSSLKIVGTGSGVDFPT